MRVKENKIICLNIFPEGMSLTVKSRYYRIQRSSRLSSCCLAIALLLLVVALAAVFRPGYTVGMNSIGTFSGAGASPADQPTSLPADQTSPIPIEQQVEALPAAGEADYTEPSHAKPAKPSPPTHPAVAGAYDYSKPVPATDATVTDNYFQDSVFIGDSRTEGFQLFSGPQNATYYTSNGLKVDTIFTRQVVKTANGEKITILEALRQKPFKKVYIMLGVNELGWAYSDLFIKKYAEVIAEIKNIEPEAQIYVQSLLPVSEERSQSDEIYNSTNIGKYNALIRQMAAENSLYYLDVAQSVADDEGNLYSDASSDGIHLNKKYCDLWLDYLKLHYVSK